MILEKILKNGRPPVVEEEVGELLLTVNCQDKNSVKVAKEKEIQNWQDSHIYTEVPDP